MQVRRPLSTARGVPVQELRDFWRNVACVAVQTTSVVAVATTCCDEDNMDRILDSLVSIALDLTSALSAADRHDRLVASVHRALPCDSAALMRFEGDVLVAVATQGLTDDVRGRRYARSSHPRLDAICAAEHPVQFPADSRTKPDLRTARRGCHALQPIPIGKE